MSSPVVNIFIKPHYGESKAIICWELSDDSFLDSNFIIQKSPDGYSNWETIHSAKNITCFSDNFLNPDNIHDTTHYKVIVQYEGRRYDSNPVGIFDQLHPAEFAALRRMINLEIATMARGRKGFEFFVFKPLRQGTLSNSVDADTKQNVGLSLDDESFGNEYEGGYDDPIQIWGMILESEPHMMKPDPKGSGFKVDLQNTLRVVSYPELHRGDLIVNPRTDDRYLVNAFKRFKFRGLIPFVDHVDMSRIDRRDVKHKIKVPEL